MSKLKTMNGVYIHETAEVHENASIGKGTYIWNQAQIRENASIGVNCVISKDVYIDIDVIVGSNVKIQNGVSIYKGVTIEDDVFVGPHVVFTNDLRPRAFNNEWEVTDALLRKGCSIGANATIVAGNVIGPYSMVAAGAVITQDVPPFSLVLGNPARIVGFVCKLGHKMKKVNKLTEQLSYYCEICEEDILIKLDVHCNK
jgi:UDP-2-acetamido-3-amino-2,3-dideoxy-glucuronate N-acetyltransferase